VVDAYPDFFTGNKFPFHQVSFKDFVSQILRHRFNFILSVRILEMQTKFLGIPEYSTGVIECQKTIQPVE